MYNRTLSKSLKHWCRIGIFCLDFDWFHTFHLLLDWEFNTHKRIKFVRIETKSLRFQVPCWTLWSKFPFLIVFEYTDYWWSRSYYDNCSTSALILIRSLFWKIYHIVWSVMHKIGSLSANFVRSLKIFLGPPEGLNNRISSGALRLSMGKSPIWPRPFFRLIGHRRTQWIWLYVSFMECWVSKPTFLWPESLIKASI